MTSPRLHAAALALVGACFAAGVQTSAGEPAQAQDEVVVHVPTPKIWKLTRGASTVYVVGSIGLIPGGARWNKVPIERIMDHADRFITPPYETMNPGGEAFRMLLPITRSLDGELSDGARDRLHAVLARLHRPPNSLDRYKAAVAAYRLLSELPGGGNVLANEPLTTLRAMAARKGLEVTDAYRGDGRPLLAALNDTPEARGIDLLDKAIAQADDYLDHADALDEAWRTGDLEALAMAQAHRPNPMTVIKAAAPEAYAASARQEDGRFIAAVDGALSKPGVTVTVVQIGLLGPGSRFIQGLRALGVQVIEPEG